MLLRQFQRNLKENFSGLSNKNCKLLLAVSGGIDSSVMTHLFYNAGFEFAIAHCNFQLRGEESERDENFVRSLASTYNKEIFVKRFDTKQYAGQYKISIQEAARKLRYDWFEEILSQLSTVNRQLFLATAHNADDNIETLLLFFFRGTGLQGLTGIPFYDKERKIIRPLLFALRKDIADYARENNMRWVEDSSNASEKYTRNFFRNNLLPETAKHFSNVKDNLLQNIKRLGEANQLYQHAISSYKKKLLVIKGNEVHIPILKLQHIKPLDTILWEILKEYKFHAQQIDEVKKLFDSQNGKYVSSSSHRIIKNRNWLIIAPNSGEESEHILIEEADNKVIFKNGVLQFEKLSAINYQLSAISSVAQLDAKYIEFPLLLRKWKQGDYFYPLGMIKKKKLSRFFIDKKLSKIEKENVWILEMNKKIIWVINQRIDDRFKISATTKKIYKITIIA